MQDIVEGVHRFHDRREQNLELYRRLADEGQAPKVLFIGCSDSRVPPEVIVDAGPGVLFVTRNIANVVPPYGSGETAVGAVVEYAVRHLHIQQIILCGHTDCGGIKALDAQPNWDREPHIARWLRVAAWALVGVAFYLAFVTLDSARPFGIGTISGSSRVEIVS